MTLGLCQITNDAEATIAFLEKYGKHFDKWFITVADKDKKQYKKLAEYADDAHPSLVLSYFPWIDDFSAARNANLKAVDTDYWFWADSDDNIENPERLPELLRFMAEKNVEVVQLKYDYAQNEQGQAISDHWRERLIKTSYEGQWDAPVHETFQGPVAVVERLEGVGVKHDKNPDDMAKSMARNETILRDHFAKTNDPRDASYLGMTELANRNYKEAIQWFLTHIETSGSDEDRYRSWCRIADCEWLRGNNEQSLYATDEAIKLRPAFPDAYFIKIMNYAKMEEYEKGVEWLQVATSKPIPDTLHMVDPTLYTHRGLAMGAMCYLFSGQVKEAFRLYQLVTKENPDFYKREKEIDGVDWEAIYEDAYFDQKAIDYTKWLLHYTKGVGGNPIKLFEALPQRILADTRLNGERTKFMPAKKWPEKSIVFYCGPSGEAWGPDTLDKGMGGSEEAIVYLSRELAKLGWQVTVYNDRDEEYGDQWVIDLPEQEDQMGGVVTYLPWQLFNPNDTFDVFVAWRNPSFARAVSVKARVKAVDFHDLPGVVAQADIKNNDKFFVKSAYHAALLPEEAQDKVEVIGNGIVRSQFK